MNYDDQHRKHLMAYLQQIERLFYQLVGTAVFIALKTDYKELIASTLFAFANTKKGKSFEKELANFSNQLDQIIKQGITKEWNFANIKQDKLLREGLTKYKNLEALETFKTRKIKDFTISDRVWDIAKKAQTELELALSVSLEEGKSAVQLSREIRNLLTNPPALFRRIRDKYGNLVLSKNAQNYHPGQGVYRSAYKNALRLASNEINVAYKSADWLRIQQNPDVVGFEVRLSPQHKVSDVPKEYKQWVTDNKDRFKNWKTKPYFIEANKGVIAPTMNDDIILKSRYNNITFSEKYKGKRGGIVEVFNNGKQRKQEYNKNLNALKILADTGERYRMLPIIEDGNKNPDAFNLKTKKYTDIKIAESTNAKNIIQSAMKEPSKQKASEVIIHLPIKPDSYKQMYRSLRSKLNEGHYQSLEILTVIYPNNQVKIYNLNRIREYIKKTPQI